jgi:ketosteroid isomerase-like protein
MNQLTTAVLIGVFALAGFTAVVQAAVDLEAERAAVAKAVDASIGWFATKDFDLLYSTLADDPDYFVFQPNSRGTVKGIQQSRERSVMFRDPDAKYLSHEIRDLRIHIHPSGEVAWFSAILDDCGEYGGQKVCWLDTRWTGVLEKREKRWVVMQMHFSFAADHVREQTEKSVREALQKQSPRPNTTR